MVSTPSGHLVKQESVQLFGSMCPDWEMRVRHLSHDFAGGFVRQDNVEWFRCDVIGKRQGDVVGLDWGLCERFQFLDVVGRVIGTTCRPRKAGFQTAHCIIRMLGSTQGWWEEWRHTWLCRVFSNLSIVKNAPKMNDKSAIANSMT